jgi:hypothetical protein
MTSELVFGTLFIGLAGLIWSITVSWLWKDRPAHKNGSREKASIRGAQMPLTTKP